MAEISELFPKEKGQIESTDVANIKEPLVISDTELTGETKKSLWLSFEDYPLKHRLNKKTMIALCKHFGITNTDNLVDKEISFVVIDNEVAIKELQPKEKPKKK